jgi:TPR repeat protein
MVQATWIEQAGLKGHVQGMFGAGVCHSAGFGRAQDNATALRWFCKAAKQVRAPRQAHSVYHKLHSLAKVASNENHAKAKRIRGKDCNLAAKALCVYKSTATCTSQRSKTDATYDGHTSRATRTHATMQG